MITGNSSVVEDALREESAIVPYAEIVDTPSFQAPVALYHFWKSLPGEVPHQSEIKPNVLDPKLLPFMYILDVIPSDAEGNTTGKLDFEFRLFGTGSRDHYGKEGTSRRLSAMSHDGAGLGFDITVLAYESRTAQFLFSEYYKGDQPVKTGSFVIMPLSNDAGNVSRLFGCGTWATP